MKSLKCVNIFHEYFIYIKKKVLSNSYTLLANRGTMDERCIVGAWRLTIQDDGEARYKERQWSIQHPLQRQKLRHILIHDNMDNLLYFIFVLFINLYIYIYVCMYLHLFIWFLVQYETYEIFRGLRFI